MGDPRDGARKAAHPMNDDLFREEARRHLVEPELGTLLRPMARWVHWAWWLLLASGASACAAVSLGSLSVYEFAPAVFMDAAAGPSRSRSGKRSDERVEPDFVARVSEKIQSRLIASRRAEVRIAGGTAWVPAWIDSSSAGPTASSEARLLEANPNEAPPSGGSALVHGHLDSDQTPFALGRPSVGARATMRIEVGRERLVYQLLPGLRRE
jgi:hypothetical protein